MAEPKMTMTIASPVTPTPDKWKGIKQVFLNLHQDQTAEADTVLTEKIMRALGAERLVGKSNVVHMRVTVDNGVATLTGHVVQSSHKVQAEVTAREASGVMTIVNLLVVDYELMINVAQALGHDPKTQDEQIQVNVQHGVVYLGGFVNRKPVRAAAAQVAANIPQVRGIINVIQTPSFVMETDEERFLQPQIESIMYATDGQIGRVQQVVINPQNRRVSAVIVQAQIAIPQNFAWAHLPTDRLQPSRDLIIPISSIRCAPSGALFLNVNGGEATHFADFNPLDFGPPPADWQPPYPYRSADVLFSGHHSGAESG